jgi:hypothetical protein
VYIVWGKVPHDPREPRLWGVCSAGIEQQSRASTGEWERPSRAAHAAELDGIRAMG